MIVTLVHVWVREPFLNAFLEATEENHRNSVLEPGNLRFDILQDERDPAKFVFYEVFESDAAVAAHKETAHYKKWRDTVADWMAQPRQGVRHCVVQPLSKEDW
jgi:(4S)-4-hydroxy-5-phosphonooxypentane-2,3-dione isomerase